MILRASLSREMWRLADHCMDCRRCRRALSSHQAVGYCGVGQPLADEIRRRHGARASG